MTKKILPLILILLAAAPALAAPGDETAPPRPARPSNSGMMRYDTNKDGKLSKDELFSRTRQAASTVLPNDRTLQALGINQPVARR